MDNRLFPRRNQRRTECVTALPARSGAVSWQPDVPRTGFGHILVAVDFSDSAGAALDHALVLAEKFNAALTLVHVIEPYFYQDDVLAASDLDDVNTRWVRKQKEKLEILRQSRVNTGTPSTVVVTEGTAWTRIVDTAKSCHADLIVIGTRGLTGLKHVLVGSTAERVVRHAGCPVLVVHAPAKA